MLQRHLKIAARMRRDLEDLDKSLSSATGDSKEMEDTINAYWDNLELMAKEYGQLADEHEKLIDKIKSLVEEAGEG